MININTKEYWENRFSKNWKKSGKQQTTEYAIANIKNLPLKPDFKGTILDFGCAMGDAIPIYSQHFPQAKLIGFDISEIAIEVCRKKYGLIADFYVGSIKDIPSVDVIIASHVMEHITNDKLIVLELLEKCVDMFVFVPHQETPLFVEHVNYYSYDYYDDMPVIERKVFKVQYKARLPFQEFLKNLLKLKFTRSYIFSKQIIMFHFSGVNI
jgi:ubiquinone/menaquinone biosynthesis C-methylase UbiE